VINTGLISARVKRVCNAVMNDVTSRGDGEGVSENIACRAVVDEGVRARENVCLREDEKPLGAGDGGRTCCGGEDDVPLRKGVEFADTALPPLFFLLLNWTDSNSDESAE
jgi:hypothetical protein